MMKDPTAMIVTIAKSDTTKVEGITAAEERKFCSVFPW